MARSTSETGRNADPRKLGNHGMSPADLILANDKDGTSRRPACY
jgi:hypothetical protein